MIFILLFLKQNVAPHFNNHIEYVVLKNTQEYWYYKWFFRKNGHWSMFAEIKKEIFAKFSNTILYSIIDANGNMPLEHG